MSKKADAVVQSSSDFAELAKNYWRKPLFFTQVIYSEISAHVEMCNPWEIEPESEQGMQKMHFVLYDGKSGETKFWLNSVESDQP